MPKRGREITVALCVADPALAERIAEFLEHARFRVLWPVSDDEVEADVAVADGLAGIPGVPTVALAGEAHPLESWGRWTRAVLAPDRDADALVAAVQAVARGFAVVPADGLDHLRVPGGLGQDSPASQRLTAREREVLRLLAEGASNKVIARRLGIAFSTAKFHVASVIDKLGAHTRAEAVAEGARRGLVML